MSGAGKIAQQLQSKVDGGNPVGVATFLEAARAVAREPAADLRQLGLHAGLHRRDQGHLRGGAAEIADTEHHPDLRIDPLDHHGGASSGRGAQLDGGAGDRGRSGQIKCWPRCWPSSGMRWRGATCGAAGSTGMPGSG